MSAIPGVVFGPLNPRDKHSDERRDLETFVNGDLVEFSEFRQAKGLRIKQRMTLAKHSHNYAELYTVIGEDDVAVFLLRTLDEDPLDQIVRITHGTRLVIPPNVAHLALCREGTYLLGFTQGVYDPSADIRYDGFTDADEAELRRILAGRGLVEEYTS